MVCAGARRGSVRGVPLSLRAFWWARRGLAVGAAGFNAVGLAGGGSQSKTFLWPVRGQGDVAAWPIRRPCPRVLAGGALMRPPLPPLRRFPFAVRRPRSRPACLRWWLGACASALPPGPAWLWVSPCSGVLRSWTLALLSLRALVRRVWRWGWPRFVRARVRVRLRWCALPRGFRRGLLRVAGAASAVAVGFGGLWGAVRVATVLCAAGVLRCAPPLVP